jgi:hypothetical protein
VTQNLTELAADRIESAVKLDTLPAHSNIEVGEKNSRGRKRRRIFLCSWMAGHA